MSKLAIIAADAVEITPLVRDWRQSQTVAQRHVVKVFEKGNVVVGFAGMGSIPARIAADTLYKHCGGKVSTMFSVGYAGALKPGLELGLVLEPKKIICAADDTEIINSYGTGTLISAGAVAGKESKQMMADKYQADAVDMEAYSVADVARIYGVPFRAIKVISDGFDFPMPPMGRFIDDSGRFHRASFAIYTAMRPWIWGDAVRLARNSSRASRVLCDRLTKEIAKLLPEQAQPQSIETTEVSR